MSTLQARDISKAFSGVRALRSVSLDLRPGEVHALLGENGAGKSTLLKILAGDLAPDSGELSIDGVQTRLASPAEARRLGISVIAQEPDVLPDVDVTENIFIGSLPRRGRLFSPSAARARAEEVLEDLGLRHLLSPTTLGRHLSPAQRQLVEIARGLIGNPRVVAFDEPTSSLGDPEVEALFRLIRRLRDDGVAVAYVSHRMPEIFAVADRASVLRDGQMVGTRDVASTTTDEVVRLMVGRDLTSMFAREHQQPGDVVLSVRGLTNEHVQDVDLEVRAGEVVALAGLVGAGRSELVRTIVGDFPTTSGTMELDGQAFAPRSPRDAVRAGVGLAPEERKAQALLMQRSVRDNASLAVLDRITRAHVVDRRRERAIVAEQVARMRVRTPSMEQEIRKLSGGNQQKVVLARWLARKPKLLILDEPTRGVDVGAKAEIYAVIDELARDGMAVLIVSSELPELLGLADRIVVMRGGRVSGQLSATEATEESVLDLALPHDPPPPPDGLEQTATVAHPMPAEPASTSTQGVTDR
ncbi:MAG: sugar transporter ATP-binding protein [Blastococcus sp.]|jgi:L-arabinose transport system ATP-binding protein|nr:sugar transporter ATP-binding protein [Blastococcus sp.]